jgi:hypothetical protein
MVEQKTGCSAIDEHPEHQYVRIQFVRHAHAKWLLEHAGLCRTRMMFVCNLSCFAVIAFAYPQRFVLSDSVFAVDESTSHKARCLWAWVKCMSVSRSG